MPSQLPPLLLLAKIELLTTLALGSVTISAPTAAEFPEKVQLVIPRRAPNPNCHGPLPATTSRRVGKFFTGQTIPENFGDFSTTLTPCQLSPIHNAPIPFHQKEPESKMASSAFCD